ncbi:MAG: glycoside hydrolase family 28 protein [Chloroflexota bacterium]
MHLNVKDFGAVGDGQNLDHQAIQMAMDQCSEARGGTVVVPAGTYICGTLHMRSHICLYLETGATLYRASDPALFPIIAPTPYGNLPGQIQALLWADNVENLTIAGHGIIDGGGSSALSPEDAVNERFRPALIFYRNCRNINFLDVRLQYSSFWTLHLLRCNNVRIHGITIYNNQDRINTDGIDPDGCRNVIISDCNIVAGDDCIVIKSTEGDVCEDITITNCILQSRHAALKIGTEAISDIRNIVCSNCTVPLADVVVALYMKDGSTYENIFFSNIVARADNDFPIVIDITPRYYKDPRIGQIRTISFDNISISGKGRCYIEGTPEYPVENLSFRNITWTITDTCDFQSAEKPPGARRIELDPARTNEAIHPYQFLLMHAQDISFHNVRCYDRSKFPIADRGLLYLRNVECATFDAVRFIPNPEQTTPIVAEHCTSVVIR